MEFPMHLIIFSRKSDHNDQQPHNQYHYHPYHNLHLHSTPTSIFIYLGCSICGGFAFEGNVPILPKFCCLKNTFEGKMPEGLMETLSYNHKMLSCLYWTWWVLNYIYSDRKFCCYSNKCLNAIWFNYTNLETYKENLKLSMNNWWCS